MRLKITGQANENGTLEALATINNNSFSSYTNISKNETATTLINITSLSLGIKKIEIELGLIGQNLQMKYSN